MHLIRELPETGYLRLEHIVSNKKKGTIGLIPVGATTWWNGRKTGRYPKPVKISEGCTAWRVEDIKKLILDLDGGYCSGQS